MYVIIQVKIYLLGHGDSSSFIISLSFWLSNEKVKSVDKLQQNLLHHANSQMHINMYQCASH